LWLETDIGKEWSSMAKSYQVPTPMILEGLHRTKVIKEKGKDVVQTKKPKRPSKRIEVLSVGEVKLLERLESPFDEYKAAVNSLGKSVAIKDIVKTRKDLSKIIQAMWLVVEKVSAPLTKRRTPLMSGLTENAKKRTTLNKAFLLKLSNSNFAECKADKNSVYTHSPVPLIVKCGSQEEVRAASNCEIEIHYIVCPPDCNEVVRECMTQFSAMTKIELVDARPKKVKKSKKAQRVDTFSDEENVIIPSDVPEEDNA